MNPKTWLISILLIGMIFSCKKEEKDKSYEALTHEDVESLEQSSLSTLDPIIYNGQFKGDYNGSEIALELDEDGDFIVYYKEKKIKGEWFKKDDGFLMELDSKKQLPFQFLLWSDNTTIMILNSDGTADDEGGNYLTRIEK
ncbi:hypothetical protein [Faecalibacter sp. LW9]|uniref:hypothetical protein n=1 Tax=Faecalibacter sp. LW9 TaxID=3103144 RepID=UPI002AFE6AAF|nr:hypothetical protein [Faecalibacter sp. LW9]